MAEENQSYKWTGIDKLGKRVTGVVHAPSVKSAQAEVKKMNIELVNLERKSQLFANITRQKVKSKEILLFTRYLSTMITSGLPILQALDVISREQDNPSMRALLSNIRTDIASGKTMGEAFSQYPEYFDTLYCSLIKAGEKSGTLDKILRRLADYLEKSESLRRKIKKALTYPTVIICVAVGVSLILLLFVVPQFQTIFASFGAQLPLFTRIVVDFSNLLRTYALAFVFLMVLFIWAFKRRLRTTPSFRDKLDYYILKIYVIGPLLRKGIVARYTRTLAITLDAGVPIIEAMNLMENVMGNRIYTKAVIQIGRDVAKGNQLYSSMSNTKLFPNMVVQMIAIGETSGSLAEMLNKVSDYYEEEVTSIVDNLSSLLEPFIMVLLGLVIGTFVVAMYLPIFKLGSIVK